MEMNDMAEPCLEQEAEPWLDQDLRASAILGDNLEASDFVVVSELGRGGQGQVVKAFHRPSQRIVALKVVRPDLSQRTSVVQALDDMLSEVKPEP
ncbi:hypothetical protein T484DRAFT_1805019 [Baffinella frigidus]|nr:hypothetical protein T484DRAFT_1805019 [Cryptophyta sp. CCMP2293]